MKEEAEKAKKKKEKKDGAGKKKGKKKKSKKGIFDDAVSAAGDGDMFGDGNAEDRVQVLGPIDENDHGGSSEELQRLNRPTQGKSGSESGSDS